MRRIAGVCAFVLLLAGAGGIAWSAADLPVADDKSKAPAASSGGNVVDPGRGGAFAPGFKKQEQAAPEAAPAKDAESKPAAKQDGEKKAAAGGETMTPIQRAEATPKGELKNPFTDNKEAIAEGKNLYFSYSCNGCHGGTGGGGMCPPLSNVRFVYGSDDDTLFRLIAQGTDHLLANGYKRIARENVVGPMMPFGELIKTDEELWKILAFVRTTYNGDPARRDW